jgi:hypothetical protein
MNRTSTASAASGRAQETGVVSGELQSRYPVLLVRDLLNAAYNLAGLLSGFEHRVEKVANYLVAIGRDADFLAGLHKRTDHACTGVGLAGPRWALDWEEASGMRSQARGSLKGCLGSHLQWLPTETRHGLKKQITCPLILTRACDAVVGHMLADPEQRLRQDL